MFLTIANAFISSCDFANMTFRNQNCFHRQSWRMKGLYSRDGCEKQVSITGQWQKFQAGYVCIAQPYRILLVNINFTFV